MLTQQDCAWPEAVLLRVTLYLIRTAAEWLAVVRLSPATRYVNKQARGPGFDAWRMPENVFCDLWGANFELISWAQEHEFAGSHVIFWFRATINKPKPCDYAQGPG